MKETSCRRANSSDIKNLVAFNKALAKETENINLPEKIVESGVSRLLTNPQYGFYIVAENEGKIAGSLMVTFEWSDWRDGLIWWIQSVYIDPSFRRQGVYKKLHAYVRQLAQEDSNVRGLRLYAEQENLAAHQTYKNVGMKEAHYKMFEEFFPN